MSRRSSVALTGDRGVKVDIGEKNLYFVALEDATDYIALHRSFSSVVYRVTFREGDDVVLRVSWSKYKRVAQSRGYAGLSICREEEWAPGLYSRALHSVNGTFIEVSTREYMAGVPLSETWCYMNVSDKAYVMSQIDGIMQAMSCYIHPRFMALQGRNLSTSRPVQYLNYKILLSKLTRDIQEKDCELLTMEDFPLISTLSHGNLSLDHVIVQGSKITGIVGWSKCDYVPEAMDRMHYQFARPTFEGEAQWYARLASTLLFHPPPPPLYSVSCATYVFKLRIHSTPQEYHHILREKMNEACTMLMPSVRQSFMGFNPRDYQQRSDHRSRDKHSSPRPGVDGNPFESPEDSSTSEAEASVTDTSSISEWTETDTVVGILDSLSVA